MSVVRVELKGITKFKTAAPFGNATVARRDKTSPRIKKHFHEFKTRLKNQKHVKDSNILPRIQNTWILGSVFGFWDMF